MDGSQSWAPLQQTAAAVCGQTSGPLPLSLQLTSQEPVSQPGLTVTHTQRPGCPCYLRTASATASATLQSVFPPLPPCFSQQSLWVQLWLAGSGFRRVLPLHMHCVPQPTILFPPGACPLAFRKPGPNPDAWMCFEILVSVSLCFASAMGTKGSWETQSCAQCHGTRE